MRENVLAEGYYTGGTIPRDTPMRKAVCITMIVLFLVTIFSGIAESHVHPGESGMHTFLAILFIASTLAHLAVNRKALVRYFSGQTKKAS
jgi:hypothetical protein